MLGSRLGSLPAIELLGILTIYYARVHSAARNDAVVSGLAELDAFSRRIRVLREGISEFLLPNNDFLKPEFGLYRKWVKVSIRHSRTHTSDASRDFGCI